MKFIKNNIFLMSVLAIIMPASLYAASATGSLTISAQAAASASIDLGTNTALNLGTWNGSAAISSTVTGICLYTNQPGGSIKMTMSSSNSLTGGAFFLKNSVDSSTVPYTPTFIDKSGTHSRFIATGPTGQKTVSASLISACAGTGNNEQSSIMIDVPPAGTQILSLGTYTDTLTIMVSAT